MRRLLLLSFMRKNLVILIGCVVALISFSPQGMAFTWTEIDDAGELPGTAQATAGDGPLEFITGSLESPTDVDMYVIFITGDGSFSATTVDLTTLDSQLTLFNSSGMGVCSNDDDATDGSQSTLPAFHLLTPTAPGIYYIAISDWDWDPVSNGGFIFPHPDSIASNPAVDGPTGPGGGLPIIDWDGISTIGGGSYTIALTGVVSSAFVPKPPIMPWLLLLLDD